MSRLLGFSGSSCFVDKCCVHQKDPDKKKRAIESLAGFLFYSWDMVVVYSDLYLQRLWTVYEIASFLVLHRRGSLQLWPVVYSRVVIGSICIVYLGYLLVFLAELEGVADNVPEIWLYLSILFCAIVAALIGIPIARFWAQEQTKMYRQVEAFRLAEASCHDEQDRALVRGDIVRLLKHFNYVSSEATDDVTVAKFETIVRTKVPQLMTASFGRIGIRYWLALLAASPVLGQCLDRVAAAAVDGRAAGQQASSLLLYYFQHMCCTLPMTVGLGLYLGRSIHVLENKGYSCSPLLLAGVATLVFFYVAMDMVETEIKNMAAESGLWLALQTCCVCLLVPLSYLVYRTAPTKQYMRRMRIREDHDDCFLEDGTE
jgi:hypothetical protein